MAEKQLAKIRYDSNYKIQDTIMKIASCTTLTSSRILDALERRPNTFAELKLCRVVYVGKAVPFVT